MARLPRFALPGVPQHVIQRGNNRQACFASDEDCRFYRQCLGDASGRYACSVHAYCLMTNHVHLLITPAAPTALSGFMQHLGRRYVQYFNYSYQRTGTLWEGRYKASLVDAEAYLLTCYRYIELNPVRAAIVEHPSHYRWSSYQYNALGESDKLIAPHALYTALGANTVERCRAYRALFHQRLNEPTVHNIRESLNQEVALGNDRFRADIERMIGRRARPRRRGRPSTRIAKQRTPSI
jgi:putative transposase